MASQALYRRYRSQTFSELVGQEHIVQTLRNALHEGRTAHAYLFTGPRGVGKTSVARLLAKAFNCTADGDKPCGVCESCLAVAEGRHVDVIEMDAASHTSVEDAREIIERVQFRPTMSKYKVYVIDECHMLSTAAFNALLKTLEEPPSHAVFILATTEVHKVPATILSRCQRFTFNRHTVASTAAHLTQIAGQEGFTLEAGVAEALARAATGSMRDALSVLDQLMSYGSSQISLAQVQGLLGAAQSREVITLVEAMLAGDLTAALKAVAAVASQGADLRQFARDLVEHLRDLMLLKAGGDPELIDAGEDELAELQSQAATADLGALTQWVKAFGGIDQQIRAATIAQLPLELAVVEAIAKPAPALTAVPQARRTTTDNGARGQGSGIRGQEARSGEGEKGREGEGEKGLQPPASQSSILSPQPSSTDNGQQATDNGQTTTDNGQVENWDAPLPAGPRTTPEELLPTVPSEETTTADGIAEEAELIEELPPALQHVDVSQENAAVVALERIEAAWPDVVRDVRVHDKMVYALLNSGVRPIDVENDVLVLEVASDFFLNKLNQPTTRATIERAVQKQSGFAYRIRCAVKEQHRENPNVLREQIRTSRKDPHVKAAINIFDAEIVAVETDEQ